MARPIRETPVLSGKDASHFLSEMKKVENISKEQKENNILKFQKEVQIALNSIKVQL